MLPHQESDFNKIGKGWNLEEKRNLSALNSKILEDIKKFIIICSI